MMHPQIKLANLSINIFSKDKYQNQKYKSSLIKKIYWLWAIFIKESQIIANQAKLSCS